MFQNVPEELKRFGEICSGWIRESQFNLLRQCCRAWVATNRRIRRCREKKSRKWKPKGSIEILYFTVSHCWRVDVLWHLGYLGPLFFACRFLVVPTIEWSEMDVVGPSRRVMKQEVISSPSKLSTATELRNAWMILDAIWMRDQMTFSKQNRSIILI